MYHNIIRIVIHRDSFQKIIASLLGSPLPFKRRLAYISCSLLASKVESNADEFTFIVP